MAVLTSCFAWAQAKKGWIEKLDPSLDAIIRQDAKVEIIAEGFDWSEGPLWVESEQMLLFSDVPQNIIYKWTKEGGKAPYLTPSGYTGTTPRGGEKGSNGLTLSPNGKLVLCMDGDRRIATMNAPLNKPEATFTTLTNNYRKKKFNSPNDLVYSRAGDLFFTDPPYGLEKNMDDPLKEMPFQGVYRVKKNGETLLLLDSITRPNGIGITPDQKTLIIANSDPLKPYWYAFDFDQQGGLAHPRIFYDAGPEAKKWAGLPDGLKIDRSGNVFASGPGGLWIFNREGKLLGRIRFEGLVSNCSLSGDEKTIYMTADMYVLSVKMRD